MYKTALTCGLLVGCGLVQAQEMGLVLSSVPVFQQVAVPHQSCTQSVAPSSTTGAGAVSGALTGAVLGTLIGEGRGSGALIGAIGGAVVGNRMESNANSQWVTTCTTQTTLESRLVGYTVVYDYAGKTYTAQLPQDPGPTIALQIAPAAAVQAPSPVTPAQAPTPATVVIPPTTTTVITRPSVVYAPPPVYYSPWPATSVNFGWGWHGGGHRHWR